MHGNETRAVVSVNHFWAHFHFRVTYCLVQGTPGIMSILPASLVWSVIPPKVIRPEYSPGADPVHRKNQRHPVQAICFKARLYKGKFISSTLAFPLTVDYTVRQKVPCTCLIACDSCGQNAPNCKPIEKYSSKHKTVSKRHAQ